MRKDFEIKLGKIKEILLVDSTISVNELAKSLSITPESVRKYLTYLEDSGFLYRTHGGAVLRDTSNDKPMEFRSQEKQEIKNEICREAIKYIKNNDLIFVDPSSTAVPLAKLMRLRQDVTIVTNSIIFIESVEVGKNSVILLGGNYSSEGKRCYSQYNVDLINKMNFDIAFMGTDGFKDLDGPGTRDKEAVFLNETILKRSKTKILLTDSSKFELKTHYQYAKFEDFQYLISNSVPKLYSENVSKHGTTVIDIDVI